MDIYELTGSHLNDDSFRQDMLDDHLHSLKDALIPTHAQTASLSTTQTNPHQLSMTLLNIVILHKKPTSVKEAKLNPN